MKKLFSIIFLFIAVPLLTHATDLKVTVISIHDGDTLTAQGIENKVKYKVRLMGVDTPEVDFFKSTQGDVAMKARNYLMELAPVGSQITIVDGANQVDKHGRVLGRLIKEGIEINKEMLRQGWGVLYFIYPFDKRVVSEYIKSAKEAYDNRRGIFSTTHENTELPYMFRLTVRNQEGHNPVGDFELKIVLPPENMEQIPVWRRVFFPDYEMAHNNGYN